MVDKLKNKIVVLAEKHPNLDRLAVEFIYGLMMFSLIICAVKVISEYLRLEHTVWERFSFTFVMIGFFYYVKAVRWGKRYFDQVRQSQGSVCEAVFGAVAAYRASAGDEWADVIGVEEDERS